MIDERAAFEAWLNQGHHNGANESMWKAWEARASVAAATPRHPTLIRNAAFEEAARELESLAIDTAGAWMGGVTPSEAYEIAAQDIRKLKWSTQDQPSSAALECNPADICAGCRCEYSYDGAAQRRITSG